MTTTTTTTMPEEATPEVWSATRKSVHPTRLALFDAGAIPVFSDKEGKIRLLPPGSLATRAAPTRPQHEYPIDPPPADATPLTPTPDAAVDVAAALAESAVIADDAAMRAIEEALFTVERAAPSRPVTPTVAVGPSAGDAALDEIERLAQPTRKSADITGDATDDIFEEAQRLGGVR